MKFQTVIGGKSAREITLTIVCGIVGCLTALSFDSAIHVIETFSWAHIEDSRSRFVFGGLVILSCVGLISGILLTRLAPEAAGSGIPQLKVAYWRDMGRIAPRTVWTKFVAGALAIGGGMSLGREGPTVFLSAGICSQIGRHLGAINRQGRAMSACGAAAGLAAAFNTPIAAVTFVLEEVLENLNSRLVGRILLASFVSVFCLYLLRGDKAVLALPGSIHFEWKAYLFVPIAASFAALAGAAFQQAGLSWRRKCARSKIPPLLRPMVGALVTWAAASVVFATTGHTGVLGLGYTDLNACLAGSIGLGAIIALFLGKWVATTASYAWGGCGGIFAPTLFLGAFTGAAVALLGSRVVGIPSSSLPLLAIVGMSACLGAVVRAPATSILIVFEMTHDFALVPPLMLGALISQFISRQFSSENFYSQVIRDDQIELDTHRAVETFSDWKERKLAAFATFPACTVSQSDLANPPAAVSTTRFSAYPLVDASGEILGVVSRKDLEARTGIISPATVVSLGCTIENAERQLVEAPCGILVICDLENRPLGVFTLHDLLRTQISLMDSN
jgi:CIC family chloride channel protein